MRKVVANIHRKRDATPSYVCSSEGKKKRKNTKYPASDEASQLHDFNCIIIYTQRAKNSADPMLIAVRALVHIYKMKLFNRKVRKSTR